MTLFSFLKKAFLLFCGIPFVLTTFAQTVRVQGNFPEVNGIVNALVVDSVNKKLYLGGNFTQVGNYGHYGAYMDTAIGKVSKKMMHFPNGKVNKAIPDQNGGWYIGGAFTRVGLNHAYGFSHINAFGVPDTNNNLYVFGGEVKAIAKNGNDLYIGGDFTLAGNKRDFTNYGGVVESDSGYLVRDWPAPNGTVHTAMADGSGGWYIGGTFTEVGGVEAYNFAHIKSNKQVDTAFVGFYHTGSINNAAVINSISRLDSNRILVGGAFVNASKNRQNQRKMVLVDTTFTGCTDLPDVIGSISTVISDGNGGWYVGGAFTQIGNRKIRNLAHIYFNGQISSWAPNPLGTVSALALEGSKLLVGGNFTKMGDSTRTCLALVDTLTGLAGSWNPVVGGAGIQIFSVYPFGNAIYVLGSYTSINGVSRSRIASFNRSTLSLTGWNPNSSAISGLNCIIGYKNHIYLGGTFSGVIGGSTRNGLVALDTSTGTASSWNPNVSGYTDITDITLDGSKLYVCGSFSSLSGISRNAVGCYDLNTGNLTSWAPSLFPSTAPSSIKVIGSKLYLIGRFSKVTNKYLNGFVVLDTVTGSPVPSFDFGYTLPSLSYQVRFVSSGSKIVLYTDAYFKVFGKTRNNLAILNVDGSISDIQVHANNVVNVTLGSNGRIYAGGTFTQINGISRSYLMCADSATGQVTNWNPAPSSAVYAAFAEKNLVYIGGAFTIVGSTVRNRIAAIDTAGNLITGFNPNANNTVNALAKQGNYLYVGGNFTTIGSQSRSGLAAIDSATGNASALNFNLSSNSVNGLFVNGNKLLVTGSFITVLSQSRRGVFMYDLQTSQLSPWNPYHNTVSGIKTAVTYGNGSNIFIGGSDTLIGGIPKAGLLKYNEISQSIVAWAPDISNNTGSPVLVNSIVVKGILAYIGGDFKIVPQTGRYNFAVVNNVTGAISSWTPIKNTSGIVNCIFNNLDTLYVGGAFSTFSDSSRSRVVAVDLNTLSVLPWRPAPNGSVVSVFAVANKVFIGGAFTSVYLGNRNGIASYSNGSTIPDNVTYSSAGTVVYDINAKGNVLYVGGSFFTTGTTGREYVAAYNISSGALSAWYPKPAGNVYTLAVQDSSVYVGGSFSSIGVLDNRSNLASIDLITGDVTSWNPNPNNRVECLHISGNRLYAGGQFTTMNGTTRNRVASFDLIGLSMSNWNPNASGTVETITSGHGVIYLGGSFIGIGAQTRYYVAAVDTSTGTATSWNPNPTGSSVSRIFPLGNKVFVSGIFSAIGGASRSNLACLNPTTGLATAWNSSLTGSKRLLRYRDTSLMYGNTALIYESDTAIGYIKNVASIGNSSNFANGGVVWNRDFFFYGSFNQGQDKYVSLYDDEMVKRTDWEPLPDNIVTAGVISGNKIYLGGWFANIGYVPKEGLASIELPGSYFVAGNVPMSLCKGASVQVPFTVNMNFNPGNVFTAQLSDSSGSFSSSVSIGTLTGITSGEITSAIPSNTLSGTKYRIRVISSNPADTSEDNGYNIAISNLLSVPGPIQGDTLLCRYDTSSFFVNNVNNATQYIWSVPFGWTILGASNDTLIRVVAGLSAGTISVSASNACATSSASSRIIYTDSVPSPPASIIGSTQTCKGDTTTFKINKVTSATGYQWTLPVTWTFASTNGDTIIKAIPGSAGGAVSIKASNQCGLGSSTSLTLTVDSVPAQPSGITGSVNICKGTQQTYRINKVQGATIYNWSVPSGWSISGSSNDTLITVTVGPASGLITVSAQNQCGVSSAKTLSVNADSIPSQVAAINGPAPSCTNSVQLYKINKVPMATNYSWTIPSGWIMNSGQGDTALNVTVGTSGGNILVTPSNYCGNGQARLLSVGVQNFPSQPLSIQGNAIACKGTNQTYKINSVAGVSSYSWNVPSGWIIIAGQGDTGITVVAGNSSGTLSVKSVNACGSSAWRNLFVVVDSAASQPGVISGAATACSGSSQTYTISKVPGAIAYTWVAPSGWTINGSANDTFLNVTTGVNPGQVQVYANFVCGNSVASTKNVSIEIKPQNLSSITGKTMVCNGGFNNYSVNIISNASSYNWIVPAGWTITNGAGTNNILLVTGASGVIRVVASNNCGNSDTNNLTVTTTSGPVITGIITGDTTACIGVAKTYSIAPVSGMVSYTWVLPSGWSGTSTSNTINTVTSSNSGLLRVIVSDSCGSSTASVFININPNVLPAATIQVSPSNLICSGDSVYFTSSVTNGGTNPTGEWLINGNSIATGFSYYSRSLNNNDLVTFRLASNLPCANPSLVTSNGITMVVNVTPAKPFISIAGTLLTSSSAIRNQWYYNNSPVIGATNQTYLVSQTGWYKVKVDNVLGCANTSDSVNMFISGIYPSNVLPGVSVFPSPVDNILTIRSENNFIEGSNVRLIDALGRVVVSGIKARSETNIDMAALAPGVYVVLIENDKETFSVKIIKR